MWLKFGWGFGDVGILGFRALCSQTQGFQGRLGFRVWGQKVAKDLHEGFWGSVGDILAGSHEDASTESYTVGPPENSATPNPPNTKHPNPKLPNP